MRERSPGHASDSRVVRDYDQEEAGFESNGDIKVRYIGTKTGVRQWLVILIMNI